MKPTTLLWSAAPLAALIAASFASAQTATLTTFFTADSNSSYNGHLIYNCRDDLSYWEVSARAFDGCGNQVAEVVTAELGTSVSKKFYSSPGGQCGPTAAQHQAEFRTHKFDPNTGVETIGYMDCTHGKSGCWNSDVNAGACVGSAYCAVWGWVQGVQSDVCDNVNWHTPNGHNLQGYSLGTMQ